jgi:hypothetical protein
MPTIIDLEAHKLIENLRENMKESQLDIIKRVMKVAASEDHQNTHTLAEAHLPTKIITPSTDRQSGKYNYWVKAVSKTAGSQKQAYKEFLLELADNDPMFLQKLAMESTASRRLIAKSAQALFLKGADLAHTAELLTGDWFVDVNLSKTQKIARAKIACQVANLTWGVNAKLELA